MSAHLLVFYLGADINKPHRQIHDSKKTSGEVIFLAEVKDFVNQDEVSAVPLTSRSFLWALTSGSQRINDGDISKVFHKVSSSSSSSLTPLFLLPWA